MKLSNSIVRIIDDSFIQGLESNNKYWTSLEGENPSGSIKDRMVLGELEFLFQNNLMKKGETIAEASAGSTAKSLAFYSKQFQIRCVFFVPDFIAKEDLDRLESYGAKVFPVAMEGAMEKFDRYCHDKNLKKFNQLFDSEKKRHYFELADMFRPHVTRQPIVIGGIGTGHSLIGVAERLNANKIISAEPLGIQVNGIRNLDSVYYDQKDPCQKDLFSQRCLVDVGQMYPQKEIVTDSGPIQVSDSFRLVLGACRKVAKETDDADFILVGSSNKLSR